jgi:hypothetical protein
LLTPRCRIRPLLLEFDEGLEGLGERAWLGSLSVAEPEIDHVERIEAEVLEVGAQPMPQGEDRGGRLTGLQMTGIGWSVTDCGVGHVGRRPGS